MSNCLTQTTTCAPCQQAANCTCPNGYVDALCVQYTGPDLENLDISTGEYLQDILAKLDSTVFSETDFTANSSSTILGVTGGTNGHSPVYSVIISTDEDNALEVTSLGLLVDQNNFGDGKVKVDASDEKDYLKDQLSPATDVNGILTITPTVVGGVVYMTPTINILNLINYIKDNYSELFCEIVNSCVPEESTTTTTSTSTSSTTSTSTTTTTTTTVAPSNFDISNNSGVAIPFSIFLTDQVSGIDYVVDSTTGNGQYSHYEYVGTSNMSSITIQHSPNVNVGIQVFANSIEIYDTSNSIGSLTITDVDPQADILVNLNTNTSTTTTTTTSTTSSTSTSSTTTTSSSTTTTSTTTEAQNYYLADAYQCETCFNTADDILVSLPVSFSVVAGRFYKPVTPDGFSFFISNTTTQSPGAAIALIPTTYLTCASTGCV